MYRDIKEFWHDLKTKPLFAVGIVISIVCIMFAKSCVSGNTEKSALSNIQPIEPNAGKPNTFTAMTTQNLGMQQVKPENDKKQIETKNDTTYVNTESTDNKDEYNQKETISVGNTKEFFKGKIYISVISTKLNASEFSYKVNATIGSNEVTKSINNASVGHLTKLKIDGIDYTVRVMSTSSNYVDFLVIRLSKISDKERLSDYYPYPDAAPVK